MSDSVNPMSGGTQDSRKTRAQVIEELKGMGNPDDREGLKRFGIDSETALGVRIPVLRDYAKRLGVNQELSQQLWQSSIHEARLLAIFIADKNLLDESLMENWVGDFNSWDIVDQACANLFSKHPAAYDKAMDWTNNTGEFQKRAGFALMACLAVHDKKADDLRFIRFLPLIEKHASDPRNFVKKAISWALRQIGKRNPALHALALQTAYRIREQDSSPAKWIASSAISDLRGRF